MCASEPDDGDPDFESLMEVFASGTASILDVRTVGPGKADDVEPVSDDDAMMLFGTPMPTRADFEQAVLSTAVPDKWHGGFYANLFDVADNVEAVGFWGASGD